MFVQGFQPDLSLAVRPFMSNTIQEAIEKAQMCELTFARGVAACGPASIYNTVTNPVTAQFPVPQVTCAIGAPVVSAPTIPVLNNQMEQMVLLMREVVSAVKGRRKDGNNYPRFPLNKN